MQNLGVKAVWIGMATYQWSRMLLFRYRILKKHDLSAQLQSSSSSLSSASTVTS
jgi:hypothetical protein